MVVPVKNAVVCFQIMNLYNDVNEFYEKTEGKDSFIGLCVTEDISAEHGREIYDRQCERCKSKFLEA